MASKLLTKLVPIQINSVKSDLLENTYSVLQGSILQPLLCLTYINYLNNAISFSKIHHFQDDTNFLYETKSRKDIN